MATATGTFTVEMKPQPDTSDTREGLLSRFVLDKVYSGDLSGTAQGQMLACRTDVEGSAGYVAIEVIEGKLDGVAGTFVLQHSGLMGPGVESLDLTIIPDSGTGDLKDIAGTATIDMVDGAHNYTVTYTL